MCQVSHVTSHVSPVMCHMSLKKEKNHTKKIRRKKKMFMNKDTVVELVGGGSVINGATSQSGLYDKTFAVSVTVFR